MEFYENMESKELLAASADKTLHISLRVSLRLHKLTFISRDKGAVKTYEWGFVAIKKYMGYMTCIQISGLK